MPNSDDSKIISQSEARRMLGIGRPTLMTYAARAGVTPHRPLGAGKKLPALYSKTDIELIKMAIGEAPTQFGIGKQHVASKVTAPKVEAVKVVNDLWTDFDVTARKLAQLCKALRVALLEIETSVDGKQQVKYEQMQTGIVKL